MQCKIFILLSNKDEALSKLFLSSLELMISLSLSLSLPLSPSLSLSSVILNCLFSFLQFLFSSSFSPFFSLRMREALISSFIPAG